MCIKLSVCSTASAGAGGQTDRHRQTQSPSSLPPWAQLNRHNQTLLATSPPGAGLERERERERESESERDAMFVCLRQGERKRERGIEKEEMNELVESVGMVVGLGVWWLEGSWYSELELIRLTPPH